MGNPPPPQGSNSGQRPTQDLARTDKYTQPLTKPTQPQPQPQPQRYPASPPTPPSRLTPEKRRGGGGRWLLLLLAVLLLGGGIYTLMGGRLGFFGESSAEPVVAITRFYTALDTAGGKCADARAILANPDMTAEQLCARWKALKDAGPTTTGASGDTNVAGDSASIQWVMTVGGKPNNRTISLRKQDNAWKITTPIAELLPAP